MPVIDLHPVSVTGGVNWTPSAGTVVDCVHARGSGSFMSNEAGFNSEQDFLIDASSIPAGATINSVTLVASVRGVGGSGVGAPYVDGIKLAAHAGTYSPGTQSITGSFADVSGLYPNPIALSDLATSILSVGVDNTGGAVDCQYLALTVDYTPLPPPPATTDLLYGYTSFNSPTNAGPLLCSIDPVTGLVTLIDDPGTAQFDIFHLTIDSSGNAFGTVDPGESLDQGFVKSINLSTGVESANIDGPFWHYMASAHGGSVACECLASCLHEPSGQWYQWATANVAHVGGWIAPPGPNVALGVFTTAPILATMPLDGSGTGTFIGPALDLSSVGLGYANSLNFKRSDWSLWGSVITQNPDPGRSVLVTVNRSTGALTEVGDMVPAVAPALCWNTSSTVLYAADGDSYGTVPCLYVIDPATGAPTNIVPLQDALGNPYSFLTIAAKGVPPPAPTLNSAVVAPDGLSVVLGFNVPGTPPLLPASGITGFTVKANGVSKTINSSTRTDANQVTLVMAAALSRLQAITLSYAPGNATDTALTVLDAINDLPVLWPSHTRLNQGIALGVGF